MTPRVRKVGGATIVELYGSLDMTTSDETRRVFKETVEADPRFVLIDLGGLEFLKSSGFQALYELLDLTRDAGVPLAVIGPHEGIRSVMHVFNLERTFPIYETIEDALEDLQA